jgi:hypothetical protein
MNDWATKFFEWNGVVGGSGKCSVGSVVVGAVTCKEGAVAPCSVADIMESFLGDDMWVAEVDWMATWSIGGDCCGRRGV